MQYISTRGAAPPLDFAEVLLAGLASDGGLYLPAKWPQLDEDTQRSLQGKPYQEVAFQVMKPFVGACVPEAALRTIIGKAYGGFTHKAVTPLVQLDSQLWLMEMFHGPTLAFKDIALQLLGHLFDYVLAEKKQRLTIIGATSGDTGSAAIQGCRGRDNLDIFILHPKGRVSEVQRKQMTTVADRNVHNLAIEGNFDDCQEIVKSLFNDEAMRKELNLGAINSINWARIMAQIVYYVYAAVNLGAPDRAIGFCVPTGNFGNIFAAYAAKQMGISIARLVCASNSNDILTTFYDTGIMKMGLIKPTLSPSMDIQVSSNFERLLYDLLERKPGELIRSLAMFRASGAYGLAPGQHRKYRSLFVGHRADDMATLGTIAAAHRLYGQIIDPHTAVGLNAALVTQLDSQFPLVALACAHPAKFPDAVLKAIGIRPHLPPRVGTQMNQPERMTTLPKDYHIVAQHIRAHARGKN